MKCKKCGVVVDDKCEKCPFCGELVHGDNQILITSDYPHSLMLHIKKIIDDKGISSLKTSYFLEIFKEKYPEESKEYDILDVAYKLDIVEKFLKETNNSLWAKRVLINQALFEAVKYLTEKEAVILVESFMCIFRWDIKVYAERKWDISDTDKSDFHKYDWKKARDESRKIQPLENNGDKKDYSEDKEKTRNEVSLNNIKEIDKNDNFQSYQNKEPNLEIKRNRLPTVNIDKEKVQEKTENNKSVSNHKVKYIEQMTSRMRKNLERAKLGDDNSQQMLGDYYSEEGSKHLSYNEAVYWYNLSAAKGNYKAQMQLGKIYDMGKVDVENSKQLGIKWYKKLADKGFATAQCILGLKYLWGDGVERNLREAREWLLKASKQGNEEAKRYLKNMF